MADFEITAPDGRKFVVTAPEGASQDDVLRYAQQNAPSAEPERAPAEPIGRMGRFMQGVGDLPTGFKQFMANVIPDGAKSVLNRGAQIGAYIPAVGLAARMMGDNPPADVANQQVADREAAYRDRLKASGVDGVDWARVGGQAATSIPLGIAIPGVGSYLGAAAVGAGTGAAMSGLSPVPEGDYTRGALTNAAIGGLAGAAGGAAGKLIGSVIAPRIAPNVRTLGDAGVELTPGQIVGGGARKFEDAATSIPIVGTGVANAQRRSLESFNRAVANEVLEPLGTTVPKGTPAGRALINQVDDAVSNAYSAAHARVRPFAPDAKFAQDFQTLMQNNILMPDQRAFFTTFMNRQFLPRLGKGPVTGEAAQEITSELKRYARSYATSANVPDRELAATFKGMADMFDDLLARTNPAVAPDIRKANAAFARMIRMEGASASAGATEGVFSAPQFSAAVRQASMSPRKAEFARGNALMQDLSDAGRAVLPSTVPDSGTATRGMLGLAAGTGATGAIDPAVMAAYLGATAAGRAAYSEPATRMFRAAALARRPAFVGMLGEGVRQAGQVSGYPIRGMLQ